VLVVDVLDMICVESESVVQEFWRNSLRWTMASWVMSPQTAVAKDGKAVIVNEGPSRGTIEILAFLRRGFIPCLPNHTPRTSTDTTDF